MIMINKIMIIKLRNLIEMLQLRQLSILLRLVLTADKTIVGND